MTSYVRALAWWHAIPQPRHNPNEKYPALPQRLSRSDMRKESGGELDLPPVSPDLMYLVHILFEAGPGSAAGNTREQITWSALESWQRGTGVSLAPWQLRLIRKLSSDYLLESQGASEIDAPPPWERDRDLSPEQRGKVADHIRNVLRGS